MSVGRIEGVKHGTDAFTLATIGMEGGCQCRAMLRIDVAMTFAGMGVS